MGKQHSWNSKGGSNFAKGWLTQKQVDDVKKLVSAAESKYGTLLFGDIVNSENEFNFESTQVVLGVGSPTIHSARISFSAPGQEDVDISFAKEDFGFIGSQGDQKNSHQADMITGAILLYLEENDKISYYPSGVILDNIDNTQVLKVDSDINDSYIFVKNVLGAGALSGIEKFAVRTQSEYLDIDEPYEFELEDNTISWDDEGQNVNKIPLGGLVSGSYASKGAGICSAWMPRANNSCILVLAHSGSHRSC